jgi:hypothetical protein
MGRAFALLLAAVLTALSGCRRDGATAGPAGISSAPGPWPVAAPPPADPAFDRLAACIAGLPEGPESSACKEDPCWKTFSRLSGEAWMDFDTAVVQRMKAWAASELRQARRATATLFYPFAGPDFITASALFPGAAQTVLMGLEPVGNLPDFDRLSPEQREAFFADLGELVSSFLKRGYFITREMNDIYSRGNVDGALPIIAFFLKRAGYAVADVRRLTPDGNGEWSESPYDRISVRPRRPYGVKVIYLEPCGSVVRAVYYFSCDVENKAFPADSPLYRFFSGLDRMMTFVKSGSYLLHWDNFSTLRRFILDRSLFVLQDDTAVPYHFFEDLGWQVRLFGRYATPVEDFTNVEQPDLRRAYEDPASSVSPLPFHFGYRWRTQVDNLLLAKRPRRAYKIPVLR